MWEGLDVAAVGKSGNQANLVNRQTDHSSAERKCVFQRFRKVSFKEMFWFCIQLVHCETAAYFLMINSILNNEVGKLTVFTTDAKGNEGYDC